jgi:pimeloyl-ACP methyl ester carboxylesterase
MKFTRQLLLFVLFVACFTFRCAVDNAVQQGVSKEIYTDGQVYYLYIPQAVAANPNLAAEVLAVIHGYSGQTNGAVGEDIALQNLERFEEYAEQTNTILLAPHFSETIFDSDYQRFNLDATRSDLRLIDLIERTQQTFPNIKDQQIKLFGFSGGGQFVHRFCAFHPNIVQKAIASASGWYMWPDIAFDYPLGINLLPFPNAPPINMNLFLQSNLLILVGGDDIRQGSFRTDYYGTNLNNLQGRNRRARAQNWVNAMQSYATNNGYISNISLEIVPGTEHRISKDLLDAAYNFLMN